jgi:hypothetical protein
LDTIGIQLIQLFKITYRITTQCGPQDRRTCRHGSRPVWDGMPPAMTENVALMIGKALQGLSVFNKVGRNRQPGALGRPGACRRLTARWSAA